MILFSKTRHLLHFLKTNKMPGLVPTMGNLHSGHLSLVEKSLQENKTTVVSIFVNPKQFSPGEGYLHYPRTLEEDLEKLKKLDNEYNGLLAVYAPEHYREVFPESFSTIICIPSLSKKLCGRVRTGHFDGVATVVCRLFSLIGPGRAYFGAKDYQQSLIIKQMARDLNFDILLKVLPTIRDDDGLALSSRNLYLNNQEKKQALILPCTLHHLKKITEETTTAKGLVLARDYIKETLAKGNWDYLGIYHHETLEEIKEDYLPNKYLLAGALYIKNTRLIDNFLIGKNDI